LMKSLENGKSLKKNSHKESIFVKRESSL